jgi:hypothetical protein
MERSPGWSTVDHDHRRPRDLPQHELNGTTLLKNSPRGRLEEEGPHGSSVRPALGGAGTE